MASAASQYGDRKKAIRAELIRCAKEERTIYYSELGELIGIPAIGPWKRVLDDVSREETGGGRPDVTYLLINKQTGLPGQIGFKPAKPPTPEQRKAADDEIRRVFDYYRNNPG